jgi:F0F1-type ATP synthase assembly protein I
VKKVLIYWAAVLDLVGMVVGGAIIGVFLDKKLKTSGILIAVFTLLGFFGGIFQMWKIMKRAEDGK